MPEVWIPPQMQRITGAPDQVQVDGATVRQVINNLERLHPGIKALLYDAELDDITPGLAVIVDGDVSQLGLMERVNADSEMHFLPAIGGGADAVPPGDEPDNPKPESDGSAAAPEKPPRNLYESLKDFIGVINSDEFGPEGRTMSVDTGKQFAEHLWEKYQRDQEEARQRYTSAGGGGEDGDPAKPDNLPAKKQRPETLADFMQEANLIGVLNSSELGPEGGSMSVDTGRRFAQHLWEKYQREQEEARQRYAKQRARRQQSEQE